MIDVTKPLQLADGTPAEFVGLVWGDFISARVNGELRSFHADTGRHSWGELPNLENVPADQRVRDAAPELLVALKGMVRMAIAAGLDDRIIVHEACAAIAKAEGGVA